MRTRIATTMAIFVLPFFILSSADAANKKVKPKTVVSGPVDSFMMSVLHTSIPTTTTSTTTTTRPAPPPPPPSTAAQSGQWQDPVTDAERTAWDRVNMCEEGGNWHVRGSTYSGGLGISETNWYAYGGQRDFGDEWAASPDQQIVVAMRIQTNPPDQNGCNGSW